MFLKIENVFKDYTSREGRTIRVLNNVSLAINPGEKVAIMGASGSGKSTLLYILGLLARPSSGRYFCETEDLLALNQNQKAHFRRNQLGFVFQNFCLLPAANVLENVLVALEYSSLSFKERKKMALEWLEKVGLNHRAGHYPTELSGGEAQRVALARALINQPKIILADEPTGNLDSFNSQMILDLLAQFHQKSAALIIITHNSQVADFCERKFILENGQLKFF